MRRRNALPIRVAAEWAAVADAGLHRALVPDTAGGFGVTVPDAPSRLRMATGCLAATCPRVGTDRLWAEVTAA